MKQKGILIYCDGKYYFRVYDSNKEFVDYELIADDISIEIDDESVELTKSGKDSGYIDYTAAVLGK